MYTDNRSRKLILVAHCILNQNSVSDGTADYPGSIKEVVDLLLHSHTGIVQLPCPELLCLGLDRGNIRGGDQEVLTENTRIRKNLERQRATRIIKNMAKQTMYQIEEYLNNGFTLSGIVGINRSPSCGVNTTSANNREVKGRGVFMNILFEELEKRDIHIDMIGIKSSEIEEAVRSIQKLLKGKTEMD